MINNGGEHYLDAGAIGIAVATLAGWLPAVASLLSIVWLVIRIWETETVRSWVRRDQASHVKQEKIDAEDKDVL